MIERNTPIPVTRGKIFTNAADGQTSVDVHILQGERPLAKDNATLGKFHLDAIEPQPRGGARIEVSFQIDVDGIVHVAALDLQSEARRNVVITPFEGPPEEQVRQRIEEARLNAGRDQMKKEELEAGIKADAMIRAAEMAMREILGQGPLPAGRGELWDGCERAILELKEAMASGDPKDIDARTSSLEECVRNLRRGKLQIA